MNKFMKWVGFVMMIIFIATVCAVYKVSDLLYMAITLTSCILFLWFFDVFGVNEKHDDLYEINKINMFAVIEQGRPICDEIMEKRVEILREVNSAVNGASFYKCSVGVTNDFIFEDSNYRRDIKTLLSYYGYQKVDVIVVDGEACVYRLRVAVSDRYIKAVN